MGTPYFSVASIFIQVRKNVFQILCQNLSSTLHCLGQASTNLSTAGICVSDPKRWWIIRDELFLEGNSSIINDISGGESRAFGSKSRSGKSTSKSSAFNDTFDLAFFQLKEVFTCLACRDLRATAIRPRLQAKRARWWPPLAKGSEPSTRGRGEPGKGDKELGSGTDRAMANGSLKGWCGILVWFLRGLKFSLEKNKNQIFWHLPWLWRGDTVMVSCWSNLKWKRRWGHMQENTP